MAQNDPLLLAIDVGTSSVRCSLWRADGSPVPGTQAQCQTRFNGLGQSSAEEIRQAAETTLDACLQKYRKLDNPGEIVGVGWASFAMSWLGVDSKGEAVTPVFTYADTRSGGQARRLRDQLRAQDQLGQTYLRTGTPIHSAYAPAQLLYLAEEDPDQLARVAKWQTACAHLLACWTGEPFQAVSSSEAGWTGLFNQCTDGWDESLLKAIELDPDTLPPVHDYAQGVTGLATSYAERWPELAETPFFLAVGDGAAANIGSDCTEHSRIALTIGTTAAMRVVAPRQEGESIEAPAGLWVYPVDHKRRLVGGALTDGGSLYSWLCQTLGKDTKESEEKLLKEAAALAPDEHGLTLLPFLRSERAPGWATNATLSVSGITAETTPAHLVRAGLEAVAFRFRLIAGRLAHLLPEGAEIYASGGALQSDPLWRQILADVLERPVHLAAIEEATSRGAALLAAQALDLIPDELPHPSVTDTAYPSSTAAKIYDAAAQRQYELYEKLLGEDAQFL
jgi:gluconokinase